MDLFFSDLDLLLILAVVTAERGGGNPACVPGGDELEGGFNMTALVAPVAVLDCVALPPGEQSALEL
jgi:hypothetical protein